MSNPYLAEIRMFGFGFPPRGWAQCDGQVLPISQHTALFSLLGTTYGGDGRTTFALPDLRGRVPIAADGDLGGVTGAEEVALSAETIPAHGHEMLLATSAPADRQSGGEHVFAMTGRAAGDLYASGSSPADTEMAPAAISSTGAEPHQNMQPYLAVNFAIALVGVFPSRS